ncbi:hypothetical protein SASPL_134114 [Salvia splendens]|uniref:Uncharacterized protein n=1 Tax=Salvia splendens TaxID=180675 RepID=A0A8X8X4A2_SALSN|nr:hypothetical protein SASPL_134114 [Salvia splendens]
MKLNVLSPSICENCSILSLMQATSDSLQLRGRRERVVFSHTDFVPSRYRLPRSLYVALLWLVLRIDVFAPLGFPDHPHKRFETVTYMLQIRLRVNACCLNSQMVNFEGLRSRRKFYAEQVCPFSLRLFEYEMNSAKNCGAKCIKNYATKNGRWKK